MKNIIHSTSVVTHINEILVSNLKALTAVIPQGLSIGCIHISFATAVYQFLSTR